MRSRKIADFRGNYLPASGRGMKIAGDGLVTQGAANAV
jgi:hypothetical protein